MPLIRSQIGYVPADIELYGDMKVGKLLTYMAELKGVYNPEAIDRLMADFRLEPFRKSKVKNLSQGCSGALPSYRRCWLLLLFYSSMSR